MDVVRSWGPGGSPLRGLGSNSPDTACPLSVTGWLQLEDLSQVLRQTTGWQIRPVAGEDCCVHNR